MAILLSRMASLGTYKMSVKLYEIFLKIQEFFVKTLVFLLKPLDKFLLYCSDKINKRRKESMTREKAIKLVANVIAKNVVRYGRKTLIVAEYVGDDDYISYSFGQGVRFSRYMLRNEKAKIAYDFLDMDVVTQTEIINTVRRKWGFYVERTHEKIRPWAHVKGYQATYIITK